MRTRALIVLTLAMALAGCGGSSGEDRPDTTATLLLDFQANGAHTGIFSAVERGYDAAEGVTLRVREPSSSTDAVKLLLTGRAQFAVLDIHDLALAREKGRDLVAVMAIVQRPLAAVLAQPGIRTPRDLEGRRVGVTGLPSDDAVLDSIVRGAGGDPRRVRRTTIGFTAVASLLTRKVDGVTAFWNVEGVAARAKRPGLREFRVEQFGAPAYPELVLTVTRDFLADQAPTVRATVDALRRGYRFTLDDPESSTSDLLTRRSGLRRADIQAQVDVLTSAFTGPTGRVGALDLSLLRRWAAWEARFGITRRAPDVAAMFEPY